MPDVASLRVSVNGEGHTQQDAFRDASNTAAAIDRVLQDFVEAIDRVTTASMTVQPKTRWHKGETQRTGWQAFRVSELEISDTARVGQLVVALADAGAILGGLSWMVTPDNEAFALARRRAGQDARARAGQYADALGVKLGPVAWASEPGLRQTDHYQAMGPHGAVMAASAPVEEEPINVNPEEMTIRAALEVGYRIVASARTQARRS